MKKLLLLLFCIHSFLYGINNDGNINTILKNQEKKKIFIQQQKDKKDVKENKIYDIEIIPVQEDKTEENCIEIKEIHIKGSSVFDEDDFEDIIKPYLNNCNGIKNLSNLTKKITNMYIKKGYITSKAYLIPQDLSSGVVTIDTIEGKINKITSKTLNISNIYLEDKDDLLNVRNLEMAIYQAQRLKSQTIDFKIIPADKLGYSDIDIITKEVASTYYGDVTFNNFGSRLTGKTQISTSLNYENLFDVSDIITLRFNTTHKLPNKSNSSSGYSLSYSVPLSSLLFEFDYSYSSYHQTIENDFFENILYHGNSKAASFGLNYKFLHSQNHSTQINSGFDYDQGNNYQDTTKFDIQSYKLAVVNLGVKHSYLNESYDYYSILTIYKGLNALGAQDNYYDNQSDFIKYALDVNFTKYFKTQYDIKFNFENFNY